MNIRSAISSALSFRSRLANVAGITFNGLRNLYLAFGFARTIEPADYRSRFARNEVANRIVKALPEGTWRGFDLVEDDDPDSETAFEAAWADLDKRLNIQEKFKRADTLAGIGRYAVILIGAPGEMDQPLESCSAEEIAYLTPYAEEVARVGLYDIDSKSPRFGFPIYYDVKRTSMQSATSINTATLSKRVHYTRIHHMADGLLDDNLYGEPRLQCVWNQLDNLEKVSGGGAEAYFRRANPGTQFDLDPTIDFVDDAGSETGEKEKVRQQVEEWEHKLRNTMFTRGVKINQLRSEVSDFSSSVESIMSLISTGTGIPQRVLMGSEQGKLAAKQDSANWDNRCTTRQSEWAGPTQVHPFVMRLIELGALPAPKAGDFDVSWSTIKRMDDEQRAKIAKDWAGLNQAAGDVVVVPDEIREVLGLAPLANVAPDYQRPGSEPVVAQGKGGATWKHVHQVADRFCSTRPTYRQRLLRRRQAGNQPEQAASGSQVPQRERRDADHEYGADRIRAELRA